MRTHRKTSESRLKLRIPLSAITRFLLSFFSIESAISLSTLLRFDITADLNLVLPENSEPIVTARCDFPVPYPAIVRRKLLSALFKILSDTILVNDAVSRSLCSPAATSLLVTP